MTNAEKFIHIFGIYATELWSKSEKEFLEWLNSSAQPEPSTIWHNTYEYGFPPEGEQVLVTYDTNNSNFFWIDESIANDKGLRWTKDCDLWEKTKWAYFSDLLKAQPGTYQNLPKPNNGFEGWIPCTERLPEEDTDVLVTRTFLGCKDGSHGWNNHIPPKTYVEVAQYFNGKWMALSDEYKVERNRHTDPIAWMPLPEPYRPEEESE